MGIYRCNKCGNMAEHDYQQGMADIACQKCSQPVKVYDTLFFVGKLLERYFSTYRELQALMQNENSGEANSDSVDSKVHGEGHNILVGVNLASTDVLATEHQHEPLKQWFIGRQITPQFDFSAVDMGGFFDEAAEELGKQYRLTKDLLGQMNWAYGKNHTGINLDIGKLSQQDGQILNDLCRRFYGQTLFAKYFYQKQDKIIRLTLQRTTAVRNFFGGGWLEWFALGKLLAEAKQRGKAYGFSCARNVKIRFGNEDLHELDVVFLPSGGMPIIVECKSGEFRRDIEKYVQLKKRLGLPDSHFVILATDVDDSQIVGLSRMYGLTFVTTKTIMKHLKTVM